MLQILLWIFLALLGLIALACAFIIFTPLFFSIETNDRGEWFDPVIKMWWGSPLLVLIQYQARETAWRVSLLGKFGLPRPGRKSGDEEESYKPQGEGLSRESISGPSSDEDGESVRRESYAPGGEDEHCSDQEQGNQGDTAQAPESESAHEDDAADEQDDSMVCGHGVNEQDRARYSPSPAPEGAHEESVRNEDTRKASGEKPATRKKPVMRKIRESTVYFFFRRKKLLRKAGQWIVRVLKSVFRVVAFDRFHLRFRSGFPDPSATGMLYGYFIGIKKALALPDGKKFSIAFEPAFRQTTTFELSGSIRAKTSLARLLAPLMIAIFTFPYLTGFVVWRRYRKFKKERGVEAVS
jgi:hypothetical protein